MAQILWLIFLQRDAITYSGLPLEVLNEAVAAGELRVFGRKPGRRGERLFLCSDIDAWLRRRAAGACAKSSIPEWAV